MKRRVAFISTCLVLCLMVSMLLMACAKETATTTTAPTQAAKVFKWRYQIQHPAGDFIANPLSAHLATMIEENTGGRIKVDVFYAPQLFPADQSLENMNAGSIELASWAGGYDVGKVPMMGLLDTPMTFPTWEDFLFVRHNLGFLDLMRQAYAPFGIIPYASQCGPQTILSKKPISSLADLKGLKMRTYGIFVDFFKELGADPSFVAMAEIYTSIATGMLDAAHTNYSTLRGQKVHELTKYFIVPATNLGFNNFNVSKKALDQLPSDLQKIVMLTGDQFTYWIAPFGIETELYDGAIKAFETAGLKSTVFPQSEWEKVRSVNDAILVKMAGTDQYATKALSIVKEYYTAKAKGTVWDLVKNKKY